MIRRFLQNNISKRTYLQNNIMIRNFSIDGYCYESSTGKRIKELKIGDLVKTPYGEASIVNIIKEKTHSGFCEMAKFNKMLITPEHHILIYDEWTKPKEVKEIKFVKCKELYDIVLDKYHVITINGNNIKTL